MNNTTLVAELNRLANGGVTYPSRIEFLEEAGAANAWAGTSGLEAVGALNELAGNPKGNWLGLDGVCNQLAGTSDLTDVMALASIGAGVGGLGFGLGGFGLGHYGY